MPLTKGLRDEENERINNILRRLIGMDYVPDFEFSDLSEPLSGLALNSETLLAMTSEEIIAHLEKLHFDWTNAELFADWLVMLSKRFKNISLMEKAVFLYNYIQQESKVFSFGIFNKIATAKSSL